MKKFKKQNETESYSSYEEYQKKIFPSLKKYLPVQVDDPYFYGTELANSSKRKLKAVLNK